jgi:hypothetical protein
MHPEVGICASQCNVFGRFVPSTWKQEKVVTGGVLSPFEMVANRIF